MSNLPAANSPGSRLSQFIIENYPGLQRSGDAKAQGEAFVDLADALGGALAIVLLTRKKSEYFAIYEKIMERVDLTAHATAEAAQLRAQHEEKTYHD